MRAVVHLDDEDDRDLRHLRWATINRFDFDMKPQKTRALALVDRLLAELPGGGWSQGDPPARGFYLVTYLTDTEVRLVMMAYFDGRPRTGSKRDAERWHDVRAGQGTPSIVAWMPIPAPLTETP